MRRLWGVRSDGRCQLRTRRNGQGRSSAWNARGGVGIIDAYDVLSQVYYWAEPTYASMWKEPLGVGAWKIKITGLLKAAADGSQFVGAVEGSPSAWASAGLLWAPLTTTYVLRPLCGPAFSTISKIPNVKTTSRPRNSKSLLNCAGAWLGPWF